MTTYTDRDRVRVISDEKTWENALREATFVTVVTRDPRVVAARMPEGRYIVGRIIGPHAAKSATDVFPEDHDMVQMSPIITHGAELIMTQDPDAPDGLTIRWKELTPDDTKETSS
jgi:hypothetical protein